MIRSVDMESPCEDFRPILPYTINCFFHRVFITGDSDTRRAVLTCDCNLVVQEFGDFVSAQSDGCHSARSSLHVAGDSSIKRHQNGILHPDSTYSICRCDLSARMAYDASWTHVPTAQQVHETNLHGSAYRLAILGRVDTLRAYQYIYRIL